jgi:hypothetical protein
MARAAAATGWPVASAAPLVSRMTAPIVPAPALTARIWGRVRAEAGADAGAGAGAGAAARPGSGGRSAVRAASSA